MEQRLDDNFKKWLLVSSIQEYSTSVLNDVFPTALDALVVSLATVPRNQQASPQEHGYGLDNPATIGTGVDRLTRIHVKWAWLLFPLMLEISVMALLPVKIILTKRRHMPIWKTSTLAVLVHGVDVADVPELAKAEEISSMDDLAGSQQFQLRVTAKGYRLARCFVDNSQAPGIQC